MMERIKKFVRRITGVYTPFGGISWSPAPDEQKREPSLGAEEETVAVAYVIIKDMEQKTRRLIAWYEGREPDTPYEEVGIEEGAVEELEGLVKHIAHQVLGTQQPSASLWEPSGIYCATHVVAQSSYNKSQVAYLERFLVLLQKTRGFIGYLEGVTANLKPVKK